MSLGNKTPEQRAAKAKKNRELREKKAQICRLKELGFTFDQIAQELGYKNRSTPKRLWDKAMSAIDQPAAEKQRKLYEARMERALRAANDVLTRAKDDRTKLAAVAEIRSIEADRAKVLGFAQPTQHRHGGAGPSAPPINLGVIDYGDLASMSDAELSEAAERAGTFARSLAGSAAAGSAAAGAGEAPQGSPADGSSEG